MRRRSLLFTGIISAICSTYACACCSVTEEAEDALQDCFLEAFTRISNLQENKAFGVWIKRIAVRKCADRLRKRSLHFEELKDGERLAGSVNQPEIQEAQSLTANKVNRAISQLPDGCRSVFTLFQMEGYDHGEISGILGISESTSKSQLFRARQLLKSTLRPASSQKAPA